ncbi:MAG: conserved putative rane protein [Francisellaceae bacterium]|nr:conserved putative rane protein [Francisellaceae bacterium]
MHKHFLVLVLCALYGLVFPLGKLTLEHAPPIFITGARMLIAGVLLLSYLFIFNKKALIFKKTHLLPAFLIGVTGVYLTNVLEFWGLQFLESGKACFIYSFSPIVTAFLSYFWFQEKISLKKWIGLGIGIVGFIPILINQNVKEAVSPHYFFFSLPELALLGAAIATSVGWIVMRQTVNAHRISPIMSNATSMLIGGAISLIHSGLAESWNPSPIGDFAPFIFWFSLLTLVSNLICYNLHAYLLKSFTATYISFAGLSTPFFAAFFGWLILNETMSLFFWISVFCVSFGLYIYYQDELNHKTSVPV